MPPKLVSIFFTCISKLISTSPASHVWHGLTPVVIFILLLQKSSACAFA